MNVTYRRAVQAHVASALDDADVGELRRILGLLSPADQALWSLSPRPGLGVAGIGSRLDRPAEGPP